VLCVSLARHGKYFLQKVNMEMKVIAANFWRKALFRRWQKLLVTAVAATALVACGGGGGGGDSSSGSGSGSSSSGSSSSGSSSSGSSSSGSSGSGSGGSSDVTPSPSVAYTKQLGVTGKETSGHSVATDASGNVYVVGATTGALDGNVLMGTRDFFVTKYDSNGVKQYTKQLGATGVETWGVSVATRGNFFYVAGVTDGGLDGNVLTGTRDFFVTKYDSNGVKQYTKQLGAAGADTEGTSVATDASGNVYVAGQTTGGLDNNTLTGKSDFFVTKYDSSGKKLYTQQLGVKGADTTGFSVATDASGNVYVAGETGGGLNGMALMGAITDSFVAKYDSSGTLLYTRQLGVTGADTTGYSVATDASGNIYVAGYTSGGLGNNNLLGTTDVFVAKYDSSGSNLYIKQLGAAGKDAYGYAVATDASGNVYVAGQTYGGLDGNILTGASDYFVTKYDSSGQRQYTRQLGVASVDTWDFSVAIDPSGNVYLTGTTHGGLDGHTLMGTSDFFVAKYNSSGVKQ